MDSQLKLFLFFKLPKKNKIKKDKQRKCLSAIFPCITGNFTNIPVLVFPPPTGGTL